MNNENDRVSSQDTQSVQEEAPEPEPRTIPAKSKSAPATEAPNAAARRPSTQMKSPLPTLATLHTPLPNISNGTPNMKPAALPTRAPGETLKYASAAAAAAASEKSNMGIAPLPPPPEAGFAPDEVARECLHSLLRCFQHAPQDWYCWPAIGQSPIAMSLVAS